MKSPKFLRIAWDLQAHEIPQVSQNCLGFMKSPKFLRISWDFRLMKSPKFLRIAWDLQAHEIPQVSQKAHEIPQVFRIAWDLQAPPMKSHEIPKFLRIAWDRWDQVCVTILTPANITIFHTSAAWMASRQGICLVSIHGNLV